MKRGETPVADFDRILGTAVASDASDIILKAGTQPAIKVHGKVLFLADDRLDDATMDQFVDRLAGAAARARLEEAGEADFAHEHRKYGRFRCNAFRQGGRLSVVMRYVKPAVPGFEDLNLPMRPFEAFAAAERGLVLVTGVTGSGKSTTVASLIQRINATRNAHIVTLEDPVEFRFTDDLSVINQREIGLDTRSWATGLRAAMREAPDVVMIGEIRDSETMSAAVAAAETGHLVISTLHTVNAQQTIERVMTFFPPHQHDLVRFQMSTVLVGIASQRLLPCRTESRMIPAVEVLLGTPRVRELLREGKTRDLDKALVESSEFYGTQTFNQSLRGLMDAGLITVEDALAASDNPEELRLAMRGISKGTDRKFTMNRG
jgi:twitching motility protein PilT